MTYDAMLSELILKKHSRLSEAEKELFAKYHALDALLERQRELREKRAQGGEFRSGIDQAIAHNEAMAELAAVRFDNAKDLVWCCASGMPGAEWRHVVKAKGYKGEEA